MSASPVIPKLALLAYSNEAVQVHNYGWTRAYNFVSDPGCDDEDSVCDNRNMENCPWPQPFNVGTNLIGHHKQPQTEEELINIIIEYLKQR